MITTAMNCTAYPDDCEYRRGVISLLMGVMGCLSFLGSVSILCTIGWFKLYDRLQHRMVMYLSVADVCQSVASISSFSWSTSPPNATFSFCTFQGFMFNFSNIASAFWNTAVCLFVTWYVISTASIMTKRLPGRKFEIASNLIWIICAIFSSVGFFLSSDNNIFYAPVGDGVWCWISITYPIERFTLHYLWIFLSFGVLIVLTTINYVFLCCNRGQFGEETAKKIDKLLIKLAGYPVIFAVVFVPLGITRLITTLGGTVSVEAVWISVILFVSNGIFNALYYGITRNLYRKWRLEIQGKTVRGKSGTQTNPTSELSTATERYNQKLKSQQ
eukprot:TRINITY_DN4721_c0_g1_i2.p1 TRINITY_DN4721_c0_g1~~TRINITY_DN4721_c0_g1_i2.p1  ORF type:complete len:330 (+),score=23.96 TRINITY_DN4721_c0_g1_i2:100-1089(+)